MSFLSSHPYLVLLILVIILIFIIFVIYKIAFLVFCVCVHECICVYIWRERDRDSAHMYLCTCVHVETRVCSVAFHSSAEPGTFGRLVDQQASGFLLSVRLQHCGYRYRSCWLFSEYWGSNTY